VRSSAAAKKKKKTKGANIRKSYSIKQKFRSLEYMEKVEKELGDRRWQSNSPKATLSDIAEHCTGKLHVVAGTLYQWLQVSERKKICETYALNYRRRGTGGVLKRRSGRPGRTPLFKLSEVIVGDEVRRRRAAQLPVSLQVVALLKEEAKREIALMESRGANPGVLGRMQECKFSGRMINAFMFRQNLSIRKVSCIKLIPLEEAVLLMRGFYKYLIFRILIDKDKCCARLLDPHFGRFLLQFRINKDEVPMRLGSSSKTIGSTTDRETHVRWLPGFGDRIATLIVEIDGTGYLLDIVIIFKGKGMRQEQYNNYPGIKVFYQDKAWINVQQETKWWRDVFLPYTKHSLLGLNGSCFMMALGHTQLVSLYVVQLCF
jgi:hypothetical protein